MSVDLDQALLLMNDWLGQTVRLLVLIRHGAPPDEPPPSGPSRGWHILLGREAQLGRPDPTTDWERQLSVGAYELGAGPLKLLLEDLPCERILVLAEEDQPPHGLAFYLPASTVVLRLALVRD